MRRMREYGVHDARIFSIRIRGLTLLLLPVLHNHCNAGSTTAVLLLPDKRDVKPYTRRAGCGEEAAAHEHQDCRFADATQCRDLDQCTATMIRMRAATATRMINKSLSVRRPAAKSPCVLFALDAS